MAQKPTGLADPEMIGGPPPDQEPDADDMGGPQSSMLSPDTVHYHEDPQNCGNCSHNQQGMCDVIGQNVTPEGGCVVWEGGGDGGPMTAAPGPAPAPAPPGPMGR